MTSVSQSDVSREFGPLMTSELLQSACVRWNLQCLDWRTTPMLPPPAKMSYITKLILSGDAVWLEDHTSAIVQLKALRKLRIREMIFTSDIVLQPFETMTRWVFFVQHYWQPKSLGIAIVFTFYLLLIHKACSNVVATKQLHLAWNIRRRVYTSPLEVMFHKAHWSQAHNC